MFRRKKHELFNYIKERVWAKLKRRKGSFFSKVGKEILLESFKRFANYTLSCFIITKSVIKDIYRLMTLFWRGRDNGK